MWWPLSCWCWLSILTFMVWTYKFSVITFHILRPFIHSLLVHRSKCSNILRRVKSFLIRYIRCNNWTPTVNKRLSIQIKKRFKGQFLNLITLWIILLKINGCEIPLSYSFRLSFSLKINLCDSNVIKFKFSKFWSIYDNYIPVVKKSEMKILYFDKSSCHWKYANIE